MTVSHERELDVLVVGAGPAGLSAARRLRESGVDRVEVVDREETPGGIPRHCWHPGYGLRDLHRAMSGPAYARRLVDLAVDSGAEVRSATTVTHWVDDQGTAVGITSPSGLETVRPRALLLASGVRERSRSARLVAGSRPAGVWTTGQLQQAVHLHHEPIGRRAVVVGAELVSYSAVMTLHDARCDVAAMVTTSPRPQTYSVARHGASLRYGVPLYTGTSVVRVIGRHRVEGVEVAGPDGVVRVIECDTVVFTGDWIPDNELARAGGLPVVAASRAPLVDTSLATPRRGVFAAGNLVHPVETADLCSLGGRHAAGSIVQYLGCEQGASPPPSLSTSVSLPLAWVSPGVIRLDRAPVRGAFVLWAASFLPSAYVEVRQGPRSLHRARVRGGLVPGRPVHVGAGWMRLLDPDGGQVTFQALRP